MMYETMKERVESALEKGSVSAELVSSEEDEHIFQKWKQYSRNNHPAVVQVQYILVIINADIRFTCRQSIYLTDQ